MAVTPLIKAVPSPEQVAAFQEAFLAACCVVKEQMGELSEEQVNAIFCGAWLQVFVVRPIVGFVAEAEETIQRAVQNN